MRGYVVWSAWPLVAWLVVYLGIRRRSGLCRTLGSLALATYAVWIASVAFFPMPLATGGPGLADWGGLNLIPVRGLIASFHQLSPQQLLRLHGGNLLLFTPFTLLGPLVWPRLRSWARALFLGVCMSLGIELLQLGLSAMAGFFYRSVDVDDVILNTIGALLGHALFRLGRATTRAGRRKETASEGQEPA